MGGREFGFELAREWTRSLAYGSLFGPWSVKVMNELDRCSKDAQNMLLTYLDRMRPGHAFIGITNLDVSNLTERFQTRFQSVRLQPPENEVLAQFLVRRWGSSAVRAAAHKPWRFPILRPPSRPPGSCC